MQKSAVIKLVAPHGWSVKTWDDHIMITKSNKKYIYCVSKNTWSLVGYKKSYSAKGFKDFFTRFIITQNNKKKRTAKAQAMLEAIDSRSKGERLAIETLSVEELKKISEQDSLEDQA